MASDIAPEPQPESPIIDVTARRRGRLGLVIPFEHIPWWGIIILIVGAIVVYSVFNNVRYVDAIYFIFDLPWNRDVLGKTSIEENGEWSYTVKRPLEPGVYTIYAEFQDENREPVGRSGTYRIKVPVGAPELEDDQEPELITSPSETLVQIESSTPTFVGTTTAGTKAVVYDDFSDSPWRIAKRIWRANGVVLTIRVTLAAFSVALTLGLIFGLMRVSNRSPDLTSGVGWRLLIGLGLIVVLWMAAPAWRNLSSMKWIVPIVGTIAFLLPAMPYTLSTLYVEVIRGIPMLVIVLYMGFAVTPALRAASRNWPTGEIDLRGLPAAIIGLAFGYGAYMAEIYRAGIESIPRGQMEAARSLGMSYFQAMRHVILPQAIRVVLPPLGNDFIAMLKDSSLISVIALPEILQQGRLWISRNFRAFEGFNSVALLYLVMTLLLSLFVRVVERKAALPGR